MADVTSPRTIEVNTDPVFQEREWRVQRFAWGVGLVAIVLIAFGIAGSGPLSRAGSEGDGGATSVDYSRFAQRGAMTTLRFALDPAGQPEVQLWLDEAVMEDYRIENIAPQPDSSNLVSDRVVHTFPVGSQSEEVEVFVTVRPERPGWLRFDVGRVDGDRLEISQLVYP